METKDISGETREETETFIKDLKEQLAIHPDNKAYQYDLEQANLRLATISTTTVGDGDNDGDDGGIGQDDPAHPGT